jgi:DNA-binding MarR family transcriptional regulator
MITIDAAQASTSELIPNEITADAIAAFDIGDHIPFLLNRVNVATLGLFEDRLKEEGLVLGAWRILAVLFKAGPRRVREVLHLTGIEPPTLSRLLADLEKRQLVVRAQSDDDARGILVQPTAEGLALAERIAPHALHAEIELLRGFTVDERNFLRQLLKRMQTNLLSS